MRNPEVTKVPNPFGSFTFVLSLKGKPAGAQSTRVLHYFTEPGHSSLVDSEPPHDFIIGGVGMGQ